MSLGAILFVLGVLYFGPSSSSDDLNEDLAEKFNVAEEKCLEIHRVSEDVRRSLLVSMADVESNVKCFLSCFFEEVGLMKGTELNRTLYDALLEQEMKLSSGSEEEVRFLNACVESVKGEDVCDIAFQYYKCLGHRYYKQSSGA
uniref:Odorant binding protein 1 n=1 Tax=Pachypeltis micranthus TaxID=1983339 RepID=A0A1W6QY69_9HEMI|nr:odorant binding protein 1 [Pachypeltis micranthus]